MRFLARDKWKPSRKNPDNLVRRAWVKLPDRKKASELIVTVFEKEGRYSVFLASGSYKDCEWCAADTQADAMNVAFDLLERLKEEEGL